MSLHPPRLAGTLFLLTGLLAIGSGQGAAPAIALVDSHGDPLPAGAIARHGTVRLRHVGVSTLTFTRDGKRLISDGVGVAGLAASDLRVWDVRTGKLVESRRLTMQESGAQPVIASDGSAYLVGQAAIYHLKDLKSEPRKVYQDENLNPQCAALSPNQSLLAVSTQDGDVVLFDFPDVKVRARLKGEAGGPGENIGTTMAFSHDAKLLAQTCMNGQVVLWDTVRNVKVHTYPVNEKRQGGGGFPTFSPDGKLLLLHQPGMHLQLFETASTKEVADFRTPPDPVMAVVFSADGKELLAVGHDNKLSRYDAKTGKEVASVPLGVRGRDIGIQTAAFSADRKVVALAAGNNLLLLDVQTGKSLHPQFGGREALRSVRWANRKEIVCLTQGNQVRHWDARTGKAVREQSVAEDEIILDVDHEGKLALVQTPEQSARMIRLADKSVVWKMEGGEQGMGATFSGDGRTLLTTTTNVVEVRDATTGKVRRSLPLENAQGVPIMAPMALSRGGRMLAVADPFDAKLTIHELATLQPRYALPTQATGVTFCPRGQHLAVVGSDNVIQVYRLGRNKPAFEVVVRNGPGGGIAALGAFSLGGNAGGALAFSPDGKLLVAACALDIRVWDMTGKPVGVFRGHEEDVMALTFAEDGRTLVSASQDGTALIWDMEYLKRGREAELAPPGEGALWHDLAAEDSARAYRAMTYLQDRPAMAVALVKRNLPPAAPLVAERVRKLIAGLDSDEARVRRDAVAGLEALDLAVEAELLKAQQAGSAEVKRAAAKLLGQLEGPVKDPSRLREVRAVEVLEAIGTDQARNLLAALAAGADARLTREAKEALGRLAGRTPPGGR